MVRRMGGEEEALRTIECLRGRLVAERVASKNAKDEAQIMGNKLIELENRLKEETKSRNRAERRLKFLMKKLESINISFTSDELENSNLTEGSEVSSVSYTVCSSSKDSKDQMPGVQSTCTSVGDSQETTENSKADNEALEFDSKKCDISDDSEKTGSSCDFVEENLSSLGEEDLHEKSNELKNDFPVRNGNSVEAYLVEKAKYDLDREDNIDDSLALVPVDSPTPTPTPTQTIDPVVLDATVRDVLDSLRHAKEKIQSQMQTRRMIKAG